mgnify:CR=1 FL=1
MTEIKVTLIQIRCNRCGQITNGDVIEIIVNGLTKHYHKGCLPHE